MKLSGCNRESFETDQFEDDDQQRVQPALNDGVDDEFLYATKQILPREMIQNIFIAYSEIQSEEISRLEKLKDFYGPGTNNLGAEAVEVYRWLNKQNWQKVPYWLVKSIINFLRDGLYDMSYSISQTFPKSMSAPAKKSKNISTFKKSGIKIKLLYCIVFYFIFFQFLVCVFFSFKKDKIILTIFFQLFVILSKK